MVHEAGLAAVLLLVFGIAASLDLAFVSASVQLELSAHAFELALIAIPMTFIVVSGGIDLSVGSTMALSAVVLGLLYERGTPVSLAALVGIVAGMAAGALNGYFVAKIRVHPLIVTLATLAAYRGLAEGISLGRPISGFPPAFLGFGSGNIAGLPIPGLIPPLPRAGCRRSLTSSLAR